MPKPSNGAGKKSNVVWKLNSAPEIVAEAAFRGRSTDAQSIPAIVSGALELNTKPSMRNR